MANNKTRNAQKKSDDGKTPPARRKASKDDVENTKADK